MVKILPGNGKVVALGVVFVGGLCHTEGTQAKERVMKIKVTLEIDAAEVKELASGPLTPGLVPCSRIVFTDGRSLTIRNENIVSIEEVK